MIRSLVSLGYMAVFQEIFAIEKQLLNVREPQIEVKNGGSKILEFIYFGDYVPAYHESALKLIKRILWT